MPIPSLLVLSPLLHLHAAELPRLGIRIPAQRACGDRARRARLVLAFAAIIRRDLDRWPGFKARDMIDVQSFIWVQGAQAYDS
jgi:hypothetical protein